MGRGGTGRTSQMILDRFMELELHFLAPICDIPVIDPLHEYCPRVCMVGGGSRWFGIRLIVEGLCYCAVYEWSIHLCAFHALLVVWRCHVDVAWSIMRPWREELRMAV
jgi:hypothetical protein